MFLKKADHDPQTLQVRGQSTPRKFHDYKKEKADCHLIDQLPIFRKV